MNYIDRIDKAFEKNLPKTEMEKEDWAILFNFIKDTDSNIHVDINDIDKKSKTYKYFESVIESFVAQIFMIRLKSLTTLKISLGALITLLLYMENAGTAVMYVYYLHRKLASNTLITAEVLAKEAFPNGMFSEEQLSDIWKAQKKCKKDKVIEQIAYAKDNLLDYLKTWKIQ